MKTTKGKNSNDDSGIAKIIRKQLKSEDEENMIKILEEDNNKTSENSDKKENDTQPIHDKLDVNNPLFYSPEVRLRFILCRYHLNKIPNFNEMVDELKDIIFEPYRDDELVIEKVYNII